MKLRVLVRQSDQPGLWVAVCLERYIAAQGETERDALGNLALTLSAEIMRGLEDGKTENPLAGIPPAPTEYWDDFDRGDTCRKRCPKGIQSKVPGFPTLQKRILERREAA